MNIPGNRENLNNNCFWELKGESEINILTVGFPQMCWGPGMRQKEDRIGGGPFVS